MLLATFRFIWAKCRDRKCEEGLKEIMQRRLGLCCHTIQSLNGLHACSVTLLRKEYLLGMCPFQQVCMEGRKI